MSEVGRRGTRRAVAILAGAAWLALSAPLSVQAASALDKITVGTDGPALLFEGIDIGESAGIWESEGLSVTSVATQGEGPLEKALTFGDVDIGLGSGQSMGFRVKGVPATAVAALSGPPSSFVLVVNPHGPIGSVADLKGRTVGVNSTGSFNDWLVQELSISRGWGPNGIPTVPLLNLLSRYFAVEQNDLAGTVAPTEQAYDFASHGHGRILLFFGDVVKDYVTNAVIASDKLIAQRPDVLRRFLEGWFKTVAYMKAPANRANCIEVIATRLRLDPAVVDKAYDAEVATLSDDGSFSPAALDAVRKSLPLTGVLDTVPAASDLYTDKFVPVPAR